MIVTFLPSSTRYFWGAKVPFLHALCVKKKARNSFQIPASVAITRHEHRVRGLPLFIKQKTPLSRRLMCLCLPLCPGYDSLPQTGWGREPGDNCSRSMPILRKSTSSFSPTTVSIFGPHDSESTTTGISFAWIDIARRGSTGVSQNESDNDGFIRI